MKYQDWLDLDQNLFNLLDEANLIQCQILAGLLGVKRRIPAEVTSHVGESLFLQASRIPQLALDDGPKTTHTREHCPTSFAVTSLKLLGKFYSIKVWLVDDFFSHETSLDTLTLKEKHR